VARIRTIKPEFWSNEKVMNSSRNSRLLFIGLWNYADDAGRIADSAKTIKAQIFPGDDDVNSEMVRGMIDDLASNGLLQKYEVDGRGYLQVTGWDHQRIDRPRPSKIPPPDSTNDRRGLATDLILSNPTVSNLTGGGTSSVRSLASALPSGALASEPVIEASRQKEAIRGSPPASARRADLEALYASKRG
jgi:hypothetical protein